MGFFSGTLSGLVRKYSKKLAEARTRGQGGQEAVDWGFVYGEWSIGQNDFEKAFFVAVEELKQRASMVGGDAVVAMRQEIELDKPNLQFFYLQMYGTAVKLK